MSMNIYFRYTVSVVWLAILCFSGCTVIHPINYPSQLPPLVTGDAWIGVCPDVAGRYADKGSAMSPEGKALSEVSLTQILHGDNTSPPHATTLTNADSVVVIGPEQDILTIQSWQGEVQLATWSQPKLSFFRPGTTRAFLCERGFIRLVRHNDAAGGPIGVGINSDFLFVRKAVDGSLVALHRAGWEVWILLLIPIWHTEEDAWYRFPTVSQSVHQQP